MELLSIVGRSVAVYLFIVIVLRVVSKKELSQLSIFNFVLIILISNAVQNAMVGADSTLQGGLVAAASLVGFDYLLEQLTYRSPHLRRLIQGKQLLLIRNGQVLSRNLAACELSRQELEVAARESGFEHLQQVHMAYLETDGKISFLSKTVTDRPTHS